MKCHFDYNPYNDNLIPCKEAGLKFSKGEILQIVNREDPNWWQVGKHACSVRVLGTVSDVSCSPCFKAVFLVSVLQ